MDTHEEAPGGRSAAASVMFGVNQNGRGEDVRLLDPIVTRY